MLSCDWMEPFKNDVEAKLNFGRDMHIHTWTYTEYPQPQIVFDWHHDSFGKRNALSLRATSHTRLKAHDHCNLRALICQKGGDRPTSLHTQRWRPEGSKKTSWMKSLHGVLHGGGLWIRFHGLPKFCQVYLQEVGLTQILGDHYF